MEMAHISDVHSSKTKTVVWALAICVCSSFPAGATQTASAPKCLLKPRGGGLKLVLFGHRPEIDPPPKTAVLAKCFARKLCSYLAVLKFIS